MWQKDFRRGEDCVTSSSAVHLRMQYLKTIKTGSLLPKLSQKDCVGIFYNSQIINYAILSLQKIDRVINKRLEAAHTLIPQAHFRQLLRKLVTVTFQQRI